MAYEPVTVNDFTTRFPQYASEDPDLLAALLLEAQAQVDNTWTEADFKPATLYYMAHLLALEKVAGANVGASSGVIVSESFGPMSRTYAQVQGTDTSAWLKSTEYGRRYHELRERNFPGVAVA